jgi:hypothetical protein
MTELAAPQISSLMEALPGIAHVLRSPVANAIVSLSRAGAGLEEYAIAHAEELMRYGVRRNLLTSDEVEKVLAEIRETPAGKASKPLVVEKPKRPTPPPPTPHVAAKAPEPPVAPKAVGVKASVPIKDPKAARSAPPAKPAAKAPPKPAAKAPAKPAPKAAAKPAAKPAAKAAAKPAPKKPAAKAAPAKKAVPVKKKK